MLGGRWLPFVLLKMGSTGYLGPVLKILPLHQCFFSSAGNQGSLSCGSPQAHTPNIFLEVSATVAFVLLYLCVGGARPELCCPAPHISAVWMLQFTLWCPLSIIPSLDSKQANVQSVFSFIISFPTCEECKTNFSHLSTESFLPFSFLSIYFSGLGQHFLCCYKIMIPRNVFHTLHWLLSSRY